MIKKILKLIGIVLATLVVSAVSIIVFQLILNHVPFALTEDQILGYSGTLGIFAGAIFIAILASKRGWCKDLKQGQFKLDHRVIIISLFVVAAVQILLNSVLGFALNGIHPLVSTPSSDNTWLDLVFSIVLAPISEELLFRFGLYGAMRHSFNKTFSMIFTAVVFTVIHGFQLQAFILCLVVGFVLALVFEKTGNIWYSISVHAALNAFVALTNHLVHNGSPVYTEINGYVIYHGVMIAGAAAIALITAFAMRKKEKKGSVQSPCC